MILLLVSNEKEKNIVEFAKTNLSDEPDLRDLSKYNFNYQYTGEKSIAPSKVCDNGQFTYFQFSNKNSEIPAIFNVDADGFESLVNYRVSADYVIVERVGAQFTLRNGSEIVCVYNINLYSSGREKSSLKNNNEKNNELKNFSPALVPNQPFQSLSPNTSNNTIIPSANQSNSSPMPNMPNMKMPGTFY